MGLVGVRSVIGAPTAHPDNALASVWRPGRCRACVSSCSSDMKFSHHITIQYNMGIEHVVAVYVRKHRHPVHPDA